MRLARRKHAGQSNAGKRKAEIREAKRPPNASWKPALAKTGRKSRKNPIPENLNETIR